MLSYRFAFSPPSPASGGFDDFLPARAHSTSLPCGAPSRVSAIRPTDVCHPKLPLRVPTPRRVPGAALEAFASRVGYGLLRKPHPLTGGLGASRHPKPLRRAAGDPSCVFGIREPRSESRALQRNLWYPVSRFPFTQFPRSLFRMRPSRFFARGRAGRPPRLLPTPPRERGHGPQPGAPSVDRGLSERRGHDSARRTVDDEVTHRRTGFTPT